MKRTVIFMILSLVLFIATHFITVIFRMKSYTMPISEVKVFLFGFAVGSFIIDVALWSAIGFQLLSIYIMIKERR